MKTRRKLELINPATGEKFKELPYHNLKETESKLTSAGNIQQKWKQTTLTKRISIVKGAMDYFNNNADIIIRDITLQMGKPISQSQNELQCMLHRVEVMCDLAQEALQDTTLGKLKGYKRFIKREPLGVVLDIAAWNYPLLIAVNIVVPAILAGNAVAIKHSSLTPLCALHFEEAFRHASAPEGLVTALILDHPSTETVIQSGLIQHVAFTGSVYGGQKINQYTKNQFMYVGMELGGKDPAYIRKDADLSSAAPGIMDGVFYNGGQSCCAVERIYVHHSLMEIFVENAIQLMNKLNIGNPLDDTTTMGPLSKASGVNTVHAQLKDAKTKGAEIFSYSGSIPESDHFISPAILTNVNHNMDVMKEETFGPIVGIMGVKSDEEAIALMNDSPYGLTASVWTNDTEKAMEIGNHIETGTFFMNRCDYLDPSLPWVGVKDSGQGCTLSTLGLQQLTRPKSYHFNLL